MRDLPTRAIDYRSVSSLTPARRNARTHSRKQIRQIATSIERFGFTNPVLVDDEGSIIAGHGRVAAAKLLGMDQIPVVALGDLSPKERQAYALADNKLALNAGWDQDLLALEFQELIDAGFEVELTGFSLAEVDFTLGLARQQQPGPDDSAADRIGAICDDFECYGYRRVGAAPRHQGIVVNSKKLRRLMREHDLQPKRRRRYVVTTDSDHGGAIFPDLAKDVVPERQNQLWVADLSADRWMTR